MKDRMLRDYFAAWTLEDWGDLAVIVAALVAGFVIFFTGLILT